MTPDEERAWVAGRVMAWREILQSALRALAEHGVTKDLDTARMALELAEVRAALRSLSERLGCNDWPDALNLGDVVEKYIARAIDFDEEE